MQGMYNVAPTVIGSDADPADALAIVVVLSTSIYFWCLWHIMQNLNKKLKVRRFLFFAPSLLLLLLGMMLLFAPEIRVAVVVVVVFHC